MKNLILIALLGGVLVRAQDGLPIHVLQSKTYDSSLFGLMQDILVEGVVEGDVGAIGADVVVKGQVRGNITVLNGSIRLDAGADVGGNLVCAGGKILVDPGAAFDGKEFQFFGTAQKKQTATLKSGLALYFAKVTCLFLFVLLIFYTFPNQIHEAGYELTQEPVRSFIKGVLTLAVFLACLFASFLLMVVGVGFLLFLIFFGALMVVAGFGGVVVCYRLGQWLEAGCRNRISMVTSTLIVALVLIFLLSVPLIKSIMPWAVLTLGVGTVVGTRFGTNKQWFTRHPRYY